MTSEFWPAGNAVIPLMAIPAQGPEAIDVIRVRVVNLSPVARLGEAESTGVFGCFTPSSPDAVVERDFPSIRSGLSSLPGRMVLARYISDNTRARITVARIIPVAKSPAATATITVTKPSLISHITIIPGSRER